MQNAPENINYLSPTGYRFQCQAFPETQFYCQQAVIPGVNISEVEVATPHRPHYVAGDRLNYDAFSITMIVDEYMRNWQEIQEWIIGLGKPEDFGQYRKAKVDDKINTQAQLFILTGSKNPSMRFDFSPVKVGEPSLIFSTFILIRLVPKLTPLLAPIFTSYVFPIPFLSG